MNSVSRMRMLARFVADQEEAAFTILVKRHSSLVMGVCRRILSDHHQAEDAAQAVFMVLARKAAAIKNRTTLASWLYGVATRTALKARSRGNTVHQRELLHETSAPDCTDEVLWTDLRPVLDQEISRLPEKYRAPFILCCLQSKTNAAAARELDCPEGTVVTRLARARARLRQRLRVGVGLLSPSEAAPAGGGSVCTVVTGCIGGNDTRHHPLCVAIRRRPGCFVSLAARRAKCSSCERSPEDYGSDQIENIGGRSFRHRRNHDCRRNRRLPTAYCRSGRRKECVSRLTSIRSRCGAGRFTASSPSNPSTRTYSSPISSSSKRTCSATAIHSCKSSGC